MIYPWQQSAWHLLVQRWQHLPHALLLSGQQGTGKHVFAENLVQTLLCEHPDVQRGGCGQCTACHLLQQHSHPDCLWVMPEIDDGNARKLQQIKVDAVRDMLAFAQLSSHQGGRRVMVVEPAESLNLQAANALLKLLEEPPAGVVLILIAHHADRLLPTLRSRLQVCHLPTPTAEQSAAYWQQQGRTANAAQLAFYAGAPLIDEDETLTSLRRKWLDILSQPRLLALLDFAAEFDRHKRPLGEALAWLYKWLVDVGLSRERQQAVYYPDYQTQLDALAAHDAQQWQDLADKLHDLLPYGQHTLNVKLQLEDLSIDYLHLIAGSSGKRT